MARMPARYSGVCCKTGARINPGDIIDYDRRTRSTVLVMRCNPVDPDVSLAQSIDPDLDPESAAEASRYLRQSMARGVSDIWNSGGREFYRNRAGRCEDAPCCGCCNI